jgi:LacI family transcriptional regulator
MVAKRIKNVKLEDLARKLGVSKVTISKALRNHPDISDGTKIKVKKLAESLGYRPNFNARNLSAKKSNIIGIVIPKIAHFFFSSVIESIYNTAFENNYESIITVSQESAEREKRYIESLLSMNVAGIIVSITEQTKDYDIFKRVMRMKVPLVFIDRVPDIPKVPSVTVDDYGGAFSAVEYFIRNGIRKIGLIGGYKHINIGSARYKGFFDAMNKYNVPINKQWIVEGGFGEEDGFNGFKYILKSKHLPKAILTITYPVALGLYEAAREAGIRIPDDIKVTCFGNSTAKFRPPSVFNYVNQPTEDLGINAVRLLCNLMNNPGKKFQRNIELPTRMLPTGRTIYDDVIVP